MDEQQQREFLKGAVERGLTIKEAIAELEGSDKSALWRICHPGFYDSYGISAQYRKGWPQPPRSECPVVDEVLAKAISILAFVYEHGRADMLNTWGRSDRPEWNLLGPSTPEQQAERAKIVRDWFAKDFLSYVQKDPYPPPVHKLIEGCSDALLASSLSPAGQTAAIMQAVLTILSGISQTLAAANVSPWSATTMMSLGSDITYGLAAKMTFLAANRPDVLVAPAPGHVHPDGDLDRALTLAEAAAFGATLGDDPDLLRQLEAAGEVVFGRTPSPPDDTEPGGVLKK